jgi:hypothetical protein
MIVDEFAIEVAEKKLLKNVICVQKDYICIV